MTAHSVNTSGASAHETSTSLVQAVPAELRCNSDIALKVRVSCPAACDLRGKIIKILSPDAVIKEMVVEVAEFDGVASETAQFVVKAPTEPGTYSWTAVFPSQETEGFLHKESSAPVSFVIKPHAISMAVWDVPSPVVVGHKFTAKVGAKCSAGCSLAGMKIEIRDHEGLHVTTGTLGNLPWSVAGALYWTTVELSAPRKLGYFAWEARFHDPDLEIPHEEASYSLKFGTARPPEHTVSVEVVDNRNTLPLKGADVLVRPLKVATDETVAAAAGTPSPPYKAVTDEKGAASTHVPEGTYELFVTMDDYLPFQKRILVNEDAEFKVTLTYWKIVEY